MIKKIICILLLLGSTGSLFPQNVNEDDPGSLFHNLQIGAVTAVTANLSTILVSPLLPEGEIKQSIYGFYGSCWCHQLENRSYSISDEKMPLCARCTGQSIGMVLAGFGGLLDFRKSDHDLHKSATLIAFNSLLCLPLLIDGFAQYHTEYESTNNIRIITGILYGYGTYEVAKELIRLLLQSPED